MNSKKEFIEWNDLIEEPMLLSKRFTKFREFPDFFNSNTKNMT